MRGRVLVYIVISYNSFKSKGICMRRKIIAIFAGAILFNTLIGIIVGISARFGITPIGQFIQSVLRVRTEEEFAKFLTSDEGFGLMSRCISFEEFVILPLISITAGFLTGWISKTKGWLCSIIAVGPFAIFIMIMGYTSLTSAFSTIICILFAAISGYIANVLFPVKQLKN